MMPFNSGFKVYKKLRCFDIISSGNDTLDELLCGGFHKDLIYLLYGDRDKTTEILLRTAVMVQRPLCDGGLGDGIKIAYIDGNNGFKPYFVGKLAASNNLSPRKVLENILIARAFTWDQMIEILETKLVKQELIKVVLISDITRLFPAYEKSYFEDLLRAIHGIKQILEKSSPLIIITAPMNKYSLYKPKGGLILSHFGSVLVLVRDSDRYTEYHLIQHPYLPEKRILSWKAINKKGIRSMYAQSTGIDYWL